MPKSGCKSRHSGGVFRHSHRHLVPLANCRTSTVLPVHEIKSKFVTSKQAPELTSRMYWSTDPSMATQATAACQVCVSVVIMGLSTCLFKLLCHPNSVSSGSRRLLHIQHRRSICILHSDAIWCCNRVSHHSLTLPCHTTILHN